MDFEYYSQASLLLRVGRRGFLLAKKNALLAQPQNYLLIALQQLNKKQVSRK